MLNRICPILVVLLLSQGCATRALMPLGNPKLAPTAKLEMEGGMTSRRVPEVSAMRVYRDPTTGEFTSPPSEEEASSTTVPVGVTNRIVPPPVLKETPVQGGGVKLDLQGHFRSYMSVTKGANGNATVHCNDTQHVTPHEHKSLE